MRSKPGMNCWTIARLKDEVERLKRPHGGIGHNRPPPDPHEVAVDREFIAAVSKEAEAIEAEATKESPDALLVARSARRLQGFGRWLKGMADNFTDEFVRAFGKSLGKSLVKDGGMAIAAGSFVVVLNSVVQSAARWLQLL